MKKSGTKADKPMTITEIVVRLKAIEDFCHELQFFRPKHDGPRRKRAIRFAIQYLEDKGNVTDEEIACFDEQS